MVLGYFDYPTRPSAPGPFQLTFSLDASFQGLHGSQPIAIAVVRSSDGAEVARGTGTVSATQSPSFSFDAGRVMQRGIAYELHYLDRLQHRRGNRGGVRPQGR